MKRLALFLSLAAMIVVAAGITFSDEVVPYPFWQHGWGSTTFWSVSNVGGSSTAIVTINLMQSDGTLVQATTGTIANGVAWMPDTAAFDGWYTSGVNLGWGTFDIQSTSDTLYLWSCVYGILPWGTAGYTIVLPQNPYGLPPVD
jgi:hypothetical protein